MEDPNVEALGGGNEQPQDNQGANEVEALKTQLAERDARLAQLEKAVPVDDVAQQLADLSAKVDNYTTAQLTETQETILNKLTGGDAKTKERIIAEFNRLKDPADTPSQIQRKLEDAYLLAERKPVASPFTGFNGSSYAPLDSQVNTGGKYSDTPQGQDLAKKLNMRFVNKQQGN